MLSRCQLNTVFMQYLKYVNIVIDFEDCVLREFVKVLEIGAFSLFSNTSSFFNRGCSLYSYFNTNVITDEIFSHVTILVI